MQTGFLWHGNIEHDDIGHVLLRQLHRDATVGRFGHHFDTGVGIEHVAQPFADERVIVGVNKFKVDIEPEPKAFPIDPQLQVDQVASLKKFKANRDMALVKAKLDDVTAAARGTQNLLYPMKEALRANATLGEVSDALREVFGVYQP